MTPGQVLAARYELREAIARGGMGEVWVGHDRVLGREVALKVLDIGAAEDDLAAERFRREATTAAALSHPHVVAVYDAGVEKGLAFLVMELLSGPTVAELIEQQGPLPVDRAVDLARQAAEGIEAVHGVGVVHRDVKPGNLMLDRHGRLKVVDFGIARLAEATAHQVTAAGDVIGSAAFLSPEQARGEGATAASDQYALGCVLMAMLTGQPPFAAEHPMGLLRKHVEARPPRVRDRRPDVPDWVDETVDGLLAKDPGRRAGAVAVLLSQAATPGAHGAGATAVLPTPPGPVPPVPPLAPTAVLPTVEPPPPAPPERTGFPRRALLLAAAGLIVLLLVAGLIWQRAGDDIPTDPDPAGSVADDGTAGPASSPAGPAAPSGDGTTSLTAALAGLRDAVQQAGADGSLEGKDAAELERQVRELEKKLEQGKADENVKKLEELEKKLDELEQGGRLDAGAAARIREAIDAVRAAA
ncbi:serine/threonine-protein kinase [Antribacter gilvus]|uniref:serine/threonine-protein kinase n=1 Tax=Antribacter gilvus TaxID=2304675 RepID=UPI000F7B637A|nr:serine/threonine-protein kinase [Antribacter gilvus]